LVVHSAETGLFFFFFALAVFAGFGVYDKIVTWVGSGAALLISNFGNLLVKGAVEGAAKDGFWGIWTGILHYVSAGIAAAIFFAFLMAGFFRAKS
jgi:stage V sporulation protein AE